jgi:hypothetical protein
MLPPNHWYTGVTGQYVTRASNSDDAAAAASESAHSDIRSLRLGTAVLSSWNNPASVNSSRGNLNNASNHFSSSNSSSS